MLKLVGYLNRMNKLVDKLVNYYYVLVFFSLVNGEMVISYYDIINSIFVDGCFVNVDIV